MCLFPCHLIVYDSFEPTCKPTGRSSIKHSSSSYIFLTEPLVLTLVTADAFEADAAVAGSRHVVTGGVVHTLTQLLAAVAKRPRRTLWMQEQCTV